MDHICFIIHALRDLWVASTFLAIVNIAPMNTGVQKPMLHFLTLELASDIEKPRDFIYKSGFLASLGKSVDLTALGLDLPGHSQRWMKPARSLPRWQAPHPVDCRAPAPFPSTHCKICLVSTGCGLVTPRLPSTLTLWVKMQRPREDGWLRPEVSQARKWYNCRNAGRACNWALQSLDSTSNSATCLSQVPGTKPWNFLNLSFLFGGKWEKWHLLLQPHEVLWRQKEMMCIGHRMQLGWEGVLLKAQAMSGNLASGGLFSHLQDRKRGHTFPHWAIPRINWGREGKASGEGLAPSRCFINATF